MVISRPKRDYTAADKSVRLVVHPGNSHQSWRGPWVLGIRRPYSHTASTHHYQPGELLGVCDHSLPQTSGLRSSLPAVKSPVNSQPETRAEALRPTSANLHPEVENATTTDLDRRPGPGLLLHR